MAKPDLHAERSLTTVSSDETVTGGLPSAGSQTSEHSFAPPVPAKGASPLGRKIGRYHIQRQIGAGGMGTVYEGRDLDLGRDVAIKLMHARADGSERQRHRILREARALAKLSHPNVVTIYEVGHEGEDIFIAMELVAGVDLRRWAKTKARPWRHVLEVYRQAGRGLAAAHAAGLVHRDFKPENVLLGDDGRVRVLDFGLARRVGEGLDERPGPDGPPPASTDVPEEITRAGALVGTPAYMAPEQFAGNNADSRTDQFAFCVAIWEAVYGQRPFDGPTIGTLVDNVMSGRIRSTTERKIPIWLRRVLERGLSTEPDDRYPSMDALLAVLEELDIERPRSSGHGPARALGAAKRVDSQLSLTSSTVSSDELLIDDRYHVIGPYDSREDHAAGRRLRAIDRLSGRTVVLGELRSPSSQRAAELADIEDEVAILQRVQALASLRHPNLVAVRDFVFGPEHAPIIVYDLALEPTSVATASTHPLEARVDLVAQLLRVVAYLHRRGVVGLGLGARNLGLFAGKPKIYDLSAYVLGRHRRSDPLTAPYLAPEILLGDGGGPRSDLFAVGVLAFEAVAGRHPFAGATVLDWGTGPPPRLDPVAVPEAIAAVIESLLAYDSAERPADASVALDALAQASGRAIAPETVETRESHLQAARFVGREAELAHFEGVLDEAFASRGSAWLLVGEGGVGKSRLLAEVSARAQVRGATVAIGRAVRDATSAFAAWHAVLHRLLLGVPIADEEALILAVVLPTLPQILNRPLPEEPPATDAEGARERFIEVVGRVLRRRGRPLLIILEDVHWARPESLALASALADLAPALPVALVASYSEELGPTLPERLPGWRMQRLGRLASPAIEALARSIFGDVEPNPELLCALQRETEGNPLFLVEILRAMADAEGGLAEAAKRSSPGAGMTGGARRLIQRRLAALSADASALLTTAALAGREVDKPLLTRLAREPADSEDSQAAVRVERVLQEAVDAMVLEFDGQDHRFSHDYLREALIDGLAEDQRAQTHARIAAALRSLGGDDDSVHAAALAHHYAGAGELEAEARYAAVAGELALRRGAEVDGARLLERALTLLAGREDELPRLERWHRQLAEVYVQLGDQAAARRHILTLLGAASRRNAWLLLTGVVRQLWHLVRSRGDRNRRPAARGGPESVEHSSQRERSRAAALDALICVYDNDQTGVLAKSVLAVNLAEQAGWTNVGASGMLGFVAASLGWRRLAEHYFSRVSAAVVAAEDERAMALARACESGFRIQDNDLEAARAITAKGAKRARALADRRSAAIFEIQRSSIAFYAGAFEAMLAHAKTGWELLGREASQGSSSDAAVVARVVGFALCMLGRLDDAASFLDEHESTIAAQQSGNVASYMATQALVWARLGRLDEARKAADAAFARFTHTATLTALNPHYFSGCIEAYLALRRRSEAGQRADAGLFARRAARVQTWHRRWAKVFVVGQAQALVYESRVVGFRSPDQAMLRATQALECARQHKQPYMEALAHQELSRAHPPGSPEWRQHALDACELFERVGAHHERTLLEREIEA